VIFYLFEFVIIKTRLEYIGEDNQVYLIPYHSEQQAVILTNV
jgi:hypothetical protein